jgi:phytol kinase
MQLLIGIIQSYTLNDFFYDLAIAGIAYGYVILTILIPVYLKKKNLISRFHARKSVHLFTGLVVLIVPFFILPLFAVFIALSLTIAVFFSSRDSSVRQLKELYESIGEEAEERAGRLQGPLFYSISITLLFFIFVLLAPDQLYFPICGIMIMNISDSLASVAGKKFGKVIIDIPYTGTKRTIEGSMIFYLSAFLLCVSVFYYFGIVNPISQQILTLNLVIAFSLVTAFVGTVIEILSPSALDDLTVPLATTLAIFLLARLG